MTVFEAEMRFFNFERFVNPARDAFPSGFSCECLASRWIKGKAKRDQGRRSGAHSCRSCATRSVFPKKISQWAMSEAFVESDSSREDRQRPTGLNGISGTPYSHGKRVAYQRQGERDRKSRRPRTALVIACCDWGKCASG